MFNKQISESRYIELREKWDSFGFYPKQTNAFELYTKNGSSWEKIPVSELTFKEWNDSWEDIPKEMLNWITSLPEFDAELFKEITGLSADNGSMIDIDGKKWSKETIKEALKHHAE